jgi:nitrite reductase/ring-hydroxylating ferredoxin subunit
VNPAPHREHGTFTVVVGDVSYIVPRFCPHRGGRLDHGDVNERHRTLRCPLHRSVFDLDTGEQLGGPPCGRLRVRMRRRGPLGTGSPS